MVSKVQTVCRVSQVHPTLCGLCYNGVMAGNLTPKEVRQMEKYRAILLYDAANDAEAAKKADAAAKAAGGKVDRLTKRAETWGAVEVPNAPTAS